MKSIGKYQVIEEVGGSPAGKTYRARDAFRNREFAVKILETVPSLSAEAKEQFCGHLASCAELTHRHIAKIHDLGEVEEGIFVAAEWRSGLDLRQFMQENPDLPLDQKLALIAQVAEGLAFAQSRGIAHGNLKPSNIFVDAARDVSILNFGIAKWLGALLEAGRRPDGLVANYLAPEQVLGQPFTERSDIFALGLMLYEFASGKYPFSADPGVIPREIVHSEPTPLRRLDAKVPEQLEQLVTRALKKDPAQRLQTAEEFASGLYLAAQQLRRIATAAAAPDPPEVEQMVSEPIARPLPPAPMPEPVIAQPAPAPVFSNTVPPETPALRDTPALRPKLNEEASQEPAPQIPVAAPKVRERPQDAAPAPRPWSARSYAAGASRPPSSPNLPKLPAGPVALQQPPEPPAYQPPESFLRPAAPPPAPVQPKISKTTKRLLAAAIGLVLAVGIVSSLVSRQNLRASQNKNHDATAVTEPIAAAQPPIAPAVIVPETRAPKPSEPRPNDIGNPESSARQTLNGPVRSYWESGRYSQALALVDQVLANDPDNDDARAWRKKIRAAQAAEQALK